MATYIYREDCGEFVARFDAADDDAAEQHVEQTFRSASNPDFDGDSARLLRVESDEDGEFETGVCSFDGIDMIEDVNQMRDC